MTQTPDEAKRAAEKSGAHWVQIRQPDVEILVQGTKVGVENVVGKLLPAGKSYLDSVSPKSPESGGSTRSEVVRGVESPVSAEGKQTSNEQPNEPMQAAPGQTAASVAVRGPVPAAKRREAFLNPQEKSELVKSAATATAIGVTPAYIASSGVLSALGAVSPATAAATLIAPYIGYQLGKRDKKPIERALQGGIVGGGMYWLGGGTLASLGTLAAAAGVPALGAYIGYRMGKNNKNGKKGALIGGVAGMAAAPVATAALTGQSLSWAGTALAAGTTGLYAGIGGAGAAILYVAGKGYQNMTGKKGGGIVKTIAQGPLLLTELAKRGVVGTARGIGKLVRRR